MNIISFNLVLSVAIDEQRLDNRFVTKSQTQIIYSDTRNIFLIDDEKYKLSKKIKIYINGKIHGKYCKYDNEYEKKTYSHYDHGLLHNKDGPASITYNNFGLLINKEWRIKGKFHNTRQDGKLTDRCAYIKYNDCGLMKSMKFYKHGKLHRHAGPAQLSYEVYAHGYSYMGEWFIDGKIPNGIIEVTYLWKFINKVGIIRKLVDREVIYRDSKYMYKINHTERHTDYFHTVYDLRAIRYKHGSIQNERTITSTVKEYTDSTDANKYRINNVIIWDQLYINVDNIIDMFD